MEGGGGKGFTPIQRRRCKGGGDCREGEEITVGGYEITGASPGEQEVVHAFGEVEERCASDLGPITFRSRESRDVEAPEPLFTGGFDG